MGQKKDKAFPEDSNNGNGANAKAFIENSGINYSTHVQSYGWLDWAKNGEYSGTGGMAKRMEAIRIIILPKNSKAPGNTKEINKVKTDVNYSTHVQSLGWTSTVKNGQLSGTTCEGKRVEAIEIKLTGELAKNYDVYYRCYCQSYGWLGFSKNGAPAGTSGLSKRIETIQIILVKKGDKAPGSTKNSYITK